MNFSLFKILFDRFGVGRRNEGITTYPCLQRRFNGFYYIAYDRSNRRSLRTKDERTASRLFREEARQLGVQERERRKAVKRIRLSEFAKVYLEARWQKVLRGELAESTFKNDRLSLANLLEAVGDVLLRQVSVSTIETFKDELLAGGQSGGSVNALLRHLSSAFSDAVEKGYLDFNPFRTSAVGGSVFFKTR